MPQEQLKHEPLEELGAPETEKPGHQLDDGIIKEPDYQLEDGEADDYDKTVAEIKNEPVNERTELKEMPVKTLQDFFDSIEERIAASEDQNEKQELMFHLLKIKSASRKGNIEPEQMYIGLGAGDEGLVVYEKPNRKLKIDGEVLDDFHSNTATFERLFTVADAVKAGIKDEGIQELVAHRRANFNYGEEARQAKLGMKNLDEKKLTNIYDWDKPEELADYFLKTEVALRLKKNKKLNPLFVGNYLKGVFKKSAPDLYRRLQKRNYKWVGDTRQIMKELREVK